MKRSILCCILLLAVVVAGCAPSPTPTPAPTPSPIPTGQMLALTGGLLIDGTGAEPVSDAAVLIQGGRIVFAGPRSQVRVPDGAEVVDVTGAAILPGFINAHIHSGFSADNLTAWAREGVTAVRDLCGQYDFALRDALNADPRHARLVAAGPMITVPDGYPGVPWGASCGLAVTSPKDARDKVNKLLDDGADVVKIAMEAGGSFDRVIPSLSPAEAKAIVETAHARGVWVTAHVLMTSDLKRALDAGVDDIAHMVVDTLSDDLARQVVAAGAYWVPTLELWHATSRANGTRAVQNLRRFVQAGGKVALGTDYDGYAAPFQLGMPIKEMEWMLQAGMTPMQVIVAGTRNAAVVCGLGNEIGTLEAGRSADVLVVDGNPLDDIHALLNVRMVLHGGVVVRE